MTRFLVVMLAVAWCITLVFACASPQRKGPSGPTLGPGIGAAIALVIAIVGAVVSLALAGVLFVQFGVRWPAVVCLASTPVPWLAAAITRRRRARNLRSSAGGDARGHDGNA